MSNFPTFKARTPVEREVGFTIAGTYAAGHDQAGEEWSETFHCVPDLPAVMITEGRLALRIVDNKTMVQAGPAARFISYAVVESERDRFSELIHDTNRLVDSELIGDVFEHLWSVYSERPTTAPAGASPNGLPNSGVTSADA